MSYRRYTRPIRRTTTGDFIQRATVVSAICVTPAGGDVHVDFYDGGSGGQIVWSQEGDNAAGSSTINFNPPMIFRNKVHGVISDPGGNGSVQIAVVEPVEEA